MAISWANYYWQGWYPTYAVDIQGELSGSNITLGATLTITGTISTPNAINVTLLVEIRTTAGALVDTIVDSTYDLVVGSNDIPTLVGSALTWSSLGESVGGYYARISVTDGSSALIEDEVEDLPFLVVVAGSGLHGRYETVV